jgi:rhodanese-related sulfurtransferase
MRCTAGQLVAHALARIENLSPDQVAAELEAGDAILVDVREPAELSEVGRIPGSVWVPRGMLEFRADPTSPHHHAGLEPDRRIILHSGSGRRSALAAATLDDMGYPRVAHLDGGITAWRQAGKPTV